MCEIRELKWVGNSLRDLKEFPKQVQQEIGFTLHEIQKGKNPSNVKPLKGFGSGIMEIVSNFDKNAYRAVYALKFGEAIYVLHCFQKKSKIGIKMLKIDINLVKYRLLTLKRQLFGK